MLQTLRIVPQFFYQMFAYREFLIQSVLKLVEGL